MKLLFELDNFSISRFREPGLGTQETVWRFDLIDGFLKDGESFFLVVNFFDKSAEGLVGVVGEVIFWWKVKLVELEFTGVLLLWGFCGAGL